MKLLHLQGIRGLAIIAVTLFHFFPKQFSNGYLGVDIFFALSGFLMTMMLNKYEYIGFREVCEFFYRRLKRIVPLYYVCTLFTLVALHYSSVSVQQENLQSSKNAIAFITNFVQRGELHGYFEKLGVAVDLFTHTWSLSLEMQFYLLFPAIFVLHRQFAKHLPNFCLAIISLASFVFYLYSDKFISFNSVFSRVWQFNAGMFVHAIMHSPTPPTESDSECSKLIEDYPELKKTAQCLSFSVFYALVSLIALIVCPETIYNHFGRIIAIVAALELFQNGGGYFLLENRVLIFMGEISYSWYLVHWPFVAYCRLFNISHPHELTAIYFVTMLIAIILHYAFEKIYLKWEKNHILLVVSFLLASNAVGIFSLGISIPKGSMNNKNLVATPKSAFQPGGHPFSWPSDFMDGWKGGYENMSDEQRAGLNDWNVANDVPTTMLQDGFCKHFEKPINARESRCVFTEGLNPNSSLKLLTIGSSYAGNLFPLIYDECRANFSRMEVSYTVGCEVLGQTLTDIKDECILDWFYLEAVKQMQPDVLFIVQRHMVTRRIINGSSPFDDWVFKIASERLAEMQKHVKRRIFILDDFPETSGALAVTTDFLRKHTAIPELNYQNWGNTIARMRMHRLATECEKCRLFDYTPQFFFNGTFKSYDPKYFVGFTTQGFHLSKEGKERVRPMINHLCKTF